MAVAVGRLDARWRVGGGRIDGHLQRFADQQVSLSEPSFDAPCDDFLNQRHEARPKRHGSPRWFSGCGHQYDASPVDRLLYNQRIAVGQRQDRFHP